MKEGFIATVVSVCSLAAVCFVVAAGFYGCQSARQSYYAAYDLCVQHGGTWIPRANDGYQAYCIGAKQ